MPPTFFRRSETAAPPVVGSARLVIARSVPLAFLITSDFEVLKYTVVPVTLASTAAWILAATSFSVALAARVPNCGLLWYDVGPTVISNHLPFPSARH